jgi:hypothetical protein
MLFLAQKLIREVIPFIEGFTPPPPARILSRTYGVACLRLAPQA